MISVNRIRFFSDLAKAEPLDKLPTGATNSQGRSGRRRGRASRVPQAPTSAAGFGTQVFVRYQGKQSPNLRQAQSASGRVFYQDVKQVLQLLRLPIPNVP